MIFKEARYQLYLIQYKHIY